MCEFLEYLRLDYVWREVYDELTVCVPEVEAKEAADHAVRQEVIAYPYFPSPEWIK